MFKQMPVNDMLHVFLGVGARLGAFWTIPVGHLRIQDQVTRMVVASKKKGNGMVSMSEIWQSRRPEFYQYHLHY